MQTLSTKILSDIVVYNKYARYLRDKHRRETFEEIVERVQNMHIKKYPMAEYEIRWAFSHVINKEILPSMRSMQFGGLPIERNNSRIYNCAYLPIEHIDAFSETMFLLLGGTGVGYSVQTHHIKQLPDVFGPLKTSRKYIIGDSIEGWSDAVKVLVESYFKKKCSIRFDFGDIRDKGAELITSGGKAPGPIPLKICLTKIEGILQAAIGRRLTALEAHDILCHIADAVLAGGIRRAAMIALFSIDDREMLNCKSGDWWELNPQRGRANNSVVFERSNTTKEQFFNIWERTKLSGCGEPGIFWTNDKDVGGNPCMEISLKPYCFCNLVDVNVSDVTTQEDLNTRCEAASIIATLQAGYTDFHYLRPIWKKTTEEDALIGVGLTGIGGGSIEKLSLKEAATKVVEENRKMADLLGINPASRCTTVKPSGTSSLALGCSSGIHAWHNDYYIRRMRIGKDEGLYQYLAKQLPALVEDDKFRPDTQAVISFPQEAPKKAFYRTESASTLLKRVLKYNTQWVHSGYIKGANQNNVSCTLSLKDKDWPIIGQMLWENREDYNGVAALPYDGGNYPQAPFEDCSKDKFDEMNILLNDIDLTEVNEEKDNTNLVAEPACAGGVCEINI